MAVCSRCAGLYAGIAVGALLPPLAFMSRRGATVVWVAFFVLLTDVLLGNWMPINHSARLATGAAAGWAMSAFMFGCLGGPVGTKVDNAQISK